MPPPVVFTESTSHQDWVQLAVSSVSKRLGPYYIYSLIPYSRLISSGKYLFHQQPGVMKYNPSKTYLPENYSAMMATAMTWNWLHWITCWFVCIWFVTSSHLPICVCITWTLVIVGVILSVCAWTKIIPYKCWIFFLTNLHLGLNLPYEPQQSKNFLIFSINAGCLLDFKSGPHKDGFCH